MNRSLSSNKKKKSTRNPFKDVNAISNHGSEASSSSSISIEAPRGCLRFFLSHSSSSSSSSNLKTPMRPKSAPVVPKENRLVSKNQQELKLRACSSSSSKVNSFQSGSDLGHSNDLISDCGDATLTPLPKKPTRLSEDVRQEKCNKSDSKTPPPIQASVSPEIQFGSSSASLACYAAGHVLSGIADKRKCRPRGILNVGQNDSAPNSMFGDPDASMVPLPTEASMHWLLSPCNEEDEDHREYLETSTRNPGGSPIHVKEFSSDVCCNDKLKSSRRINTCISPGGFQELLEPLHEHVPVFSSPHCTPSVEALPLKDDEQYIYDFDAENSPFSMASLSSGNVIVTPQSDSSAGRHAALSWSHTDNHTKHYDSEVNSVAEAFRMASLSPDRHGLIEDQVDSSFQFDCLTTTCNSISRIQKMLDDQASWHSNSTLENVSQSQLRISWREGLMSCVYDMDECDSCRCLSDEEEDIDSCSNDVPKESCQSPQITNNVGGDHILPDTSWSVGILDDKPGVAEIVKDDLPPQSCAESISTDGGGLLASRDSDWSLCYKNELFHV